MFLADGVEITDALISGGPVTFNRKTKRNALTNTVRFVSFNLKKITDSRQRAVSINWKCQIYPIDIMLSIVILCFSLCCALFSQQPLSLVPQ